jgi:hypothetical protein
LEEFTIWNKCIKHYDDIVNRKEFPLKMATRIMENKLENIFIKAKIKEVKIPARS